MVGAQGSERESRSYIAQKWGSVFTASCVDDDERPEHHRAQCQVCSCAFDVCVCVTSLTVYASRWMMSPQDWNFVPIVLIAC